MPELQISGPHLGYMPEKYVTNVVKKLYSIKMFEPDDCFDILEV